MTLTAPLLQNDYLTAATVAKTLYAASPISHVSGDTDFAPTLRGSQVSLAAGTAWIGGTQVVSGGENFPLSTPSTEYSLLVIRVVFDGETAPALRLVRDSSEPRSGVATNDFWVSSPGTCVDLPVARVRYSGNIFSLTDARLIKAGGGFKHASAHLGLATNIPAGVPIISDGRVYTKSPASRNTLPLTLPEAITTWKPFPASVNEANTAAGVDTSKLQFNKSGSVVRVFGPLSFTGGEREAKIHLPHAPSGSDQATVIGWANLAPIMGIFSKDSDEVHVVSAKNGSFSPISVLRLSDLFNINPYVDFSYFV